MRKTYLPYVRLTRRTDDDAEEDLSSHGEWLENIVNGVWVEQIMAFKKTY